MLFKSLMRAAKVALRDRDLKEANRVIAKLKEGFPTAAASHGLNLELLLKEGRLDEASQLAEHLVKRFPGSAGILYHAGIAAFRRRDYRRALGQFEESEKLFSSRKTRQWLGKTLTNLGRFEDAEAVLVPLVDVYPCARVDLAWLYERKGDLSRARALIAEHLEAFPKDEWAAARALRLRAVDMEGTSLREQVELLSDLGETVPDELIVNYFKSLVEAGDNAEARALVHSKMGELTSGTTLDLAYATHHLQMPDLAFELFLTILESRSNDPKLLNTLEYSAKQVDRVAELVTAYETIAPKQPSLYNRARKLRPKDN